MVFETAKDLILIMLDPWLVGLFQRADPRPCSEGLGAISVLTATIQAAILPTSLRGNSVSANLTRVRRRYKWSYCGWLINEPGGT